MCQKKGLFAIELKPGQLSLHLSWIVHGSGQNTSKTRRVGLAIQSYLAADVEQINGRNLCSIRAVW